MANTYLSRTFGVSPTSRTTMTISAWVKRGNISTGYAQCAVGTDGNYEAPIGFETDDSIRITGPYMSAQQGIYQTNAKFRDTSAWYHIVTQYDTTNATASDRMKLYVNGERITSFSSQTNSNQNNTTSKLLVSGQTSFIGLSGGSAYFDGCIANLYIIDGQALTPTSFGETDATTGIWKPKAYTGSYGTNGFFLKFESSGSLGLDSSGNGNNFSVAAGTPTQTVDTPSNVFCTLNPLIYISNAPTFSNGNLRVVSSTANWRQSGSTLGVSAGKWYWEFKGVSGADFNGVIGMRTVETSGTDNYNYPTGYSSGAYGYQKGGGKYENGSSSSYGASYVAGDVISVALDLTNNYLYFAKNGTWQNSGVPTSEATGTGGIAVTANQTWLPFVTTHAGGFDANFGNGYFGSTAITSPYSDTAGLGKFQYAVPAGYYSLCTKNINSQG